MNKNNPAQRIIDKHLNKIRNSIPGSVESRHAALAVESIRGEHKELNNLNRLLRFSHEEIYLAFNPSQKTLEEFESLTYDEKLRIYKILVIYYEIPETKNKVSKLDLDENLHAYTSAYRIPRIKDYESFVLEEESELEDEEDSEKSRLTELEKLIGVQKNEFFFKNIKSLQETLGFNFIELLEECHRKARTQEQKDKCEKVFTDVFNKFLTFIIHDFNELDENIKNIYTRSYEHAIPLEYMVSVTGELGIFDEELFELNPIEFQKLLIALEDIRITDNTRSQFPTWYAYYQHKYRESKMIK